MLARPRSLRCLILIVGLAATFFGALSKAQSALPDVDPAREWLGSEYADVVYSRFVLEHPGVPLVVDPRDLDLFAQGEPGVIASNPIGAFIKAWKTSSKGGFTGRLVDGVRGTFDPKLGRLIQTLENGDPLELHGPAGPEEKLAGWIFAQSENSIYPDRLLAEALRLSDGHVLTAWAATWNVVRQDWRLASVRNYGDLRSRFASLTGERHLWEGGARYVVLPADEHETGDAVTEFEDGHRKRQQGIERQLELTISKRGDEYSYLYHRLGVEILTLVSAQVGGSGRLGWLVGSAGALGEVTKFSQTAGLDGEKKKRVRNDLAAALSGHRLFALISSRAKAPLKASQLLAERYLVSNPGRYGDDYQLPKGRPAHYFGSAANAKYWAPSMSVDELKMRFRHARDYDEEIFSEVILASGDDGERLHRGLADYADRGANDSELNELLKDFMEFERGIPKELDVPFDLDLSLDVNQEFVSREIVPGQRDKPFDFGQVSARLKIQVGKILGQVEARNSLVGTGSAVRCARALKP